MKGTFLLLLCPVVAIAHAQMFSKVELNLDNANCTNGNNCSIAVYRATCPTASSCPAYAKGSASFAKLPDKDASGVSYSTQTVTASNTHFVYSDVGAAPNTLGYATAYIYAVTNTWLARPTNESGASTVVVLTPAAPHQAVINWSNPNCRTTAPCTLQVYRATCTNATTCPVYAPGNSAWKTLDMTVGLTSSTTSQATTWQYLDNDKALAGTTTYSWVATAAYTGAATASAASAPYNGTTK